MSGLLQRCDDVTHNLVVENVKPGIYSRSSTCYLLVVQEDDSFDRLLQGSIHIFSPNGIKIA